MYSNIMHGKQFIISSLISQIIRQHKRKILNVRWCHEDTRFRKKPPLHLSDRILTDPSQTFKFNSWYDLISLKFVDWISNSFLAIQRDNVVWDDVQEQAARDNVMKNSCVTLTEDELNKYDEEADKYWDSFYDIHQNK